MSAGAQPNLVQPPGSETPGGSSPTTSGTSSATGNVLNNSIDSANPKSLSGTGSTVGSGGTGNSNEGNQSTGNVDIPRQIPNQHSDDDSGCALEEYTWVPPGLKPDQVSVRFYTNNLLLNCKLTTHEMVSLSELE